MITNEDATSPQTHPRPEPESRPAADSSGCQGRREQSPASGQCGKERADKGAALEPGPHGHRHAGRAGHRSRTPREPAATAGMEEGCSSGGPQFEGDAHRARHRPPAPDPLGSPSSPKQAATPPKSKSRGEQGPVPTAATPGSSLRPHQQHWTQHRAGAVPSHHQVPAHAPRCHPSARAGRQPGSERPRAAANLTPTPVGDPRLRGSIPSPEAGDPCRAFEGGHLHVAPW